MRKIRDLHIRDIVPIIAPAELKRRYPVHEDIAEHVYESRETIKRIIRREDTRVAAIVGPCSIHDTKGALEYAKRLKELSEKVKDRIYIIMRVYFEKPRTTVGWQGLILDPYLDGSYDIGYGLEVARQILLDINSLGLPTGSEILDPIIPQYIDDLVSWAAIGARTTESQTHRNISSGLSMPVGFKNSTSGSFENAINAMQSATHPASFIGIDQRGSTCIFHTAGNDTVHLILRGGESGPNYHEEDLEIAEEMFESAGIIPSVVVDCSHANSGKKHIRQRRVLRSVIDQIIRGNTILSGFMLESNLFEGKQKLLSKPAELAYGVSVTDECIGWEETENILMRAYNILEEKHIKGRVEISHWY
ncbi:MAG: 3-deoxy-7-phosphoheptulonate synthase [Spirochaetaceae bacterium]